MLGCSSKVVRTRDSSGYYNGNKPDNPILQTMIYLKEKRHKQKQEEKIKGKIIGGQN